MEVCLLYSVSTERYWAPHLGRTYNFTRFSHYNLCNLTFAGFMGSNRSVTASGTARSSVSGTFQQQIRAIHKRGGKFLCFQSAPVFSQRQLALCKIQHSPQNNHLSNLRHPSTSAIYLEALSFVTTSSSWDPAPNFSSSPLENVITYRPHSLQEHAKNLNPNSLMLVIHITIWFLNMTIILLK